MLEFNDRTINIIGLVIGIIPYLVSLLFLIRRSGNAENVLFVVKTNIFNDHASGTELYLQDARCIQRLQRRALPLEAVATGK